MKICLFDKTVDTEEIKRAFWGEWFDVMFSWVDAGRILLSEVARSAGISMSEVGELFENWKWFKEYEGGGS